MWVRGRWSISSRVAVPDGLAYAWENYFFSCERCNTAKSNKWPEHGEYVRPDEGEPEGRFVFTSRGRVRGRAGDGVAAGP